MTRSQFGYQQLSRAGRKPSRQDGAPLATFVAAIKLDVDGRISRYIVGRSPAVLFEVQHAVSPHGAS